jgi:hypothetical protein
MSLFLPSMYLLSLFVGYCDAFASWTRTLVRDTDTASRVRGALYPKGGRYAYCGACTVSVAGACYGFLIYGFLPGTAIFFTCIMISRISSVLLRRRIHNLFHLNVVLRTLTQRHLEYLYLDDMVGARSVEGLIEKVTTQAYGLKVIKAAELVPSYEGSKLYLSIYGAKADNYHCSHRGSNRLQ